MTTREIEEYKALRATIRERGTTRVWIAIAGLAAWAAFTIATTALFEQAAATLVPLLVLATTFEIVFSLHTAVERIGRYLQVYFEHEPGDDGPVDDVALPPSRGLPGWEHQTMEYSRRFPGGLDPLFCVHFWIASVLNFTPVLVLSAHPGLVELTLVGGAHALFVWRVVLARRQSGRQRQLELERFRRLRQAR